MFSKLNLSVPAAPPEEQQSRKHLKQHQLAGDLGVTHNDQCNQTAARGSYRRTLQSASCASGGCSHSPVLAAGDVSSAHDGREEPHGCMRSTWRLPCELLVHLLFQHAKMPVFAMDVYLSSGCRIPGLLVK